MTSGEKAYKKKIIFSLIEMFKDNLKIQGF